jgi:hypothetical protein
MVGDAEIDKGFDESVEGAESDDTEIDKSGGGIESERVGGEEDSAEVVGVVDDLDGGNAGDDELIESADARWISIGRFWQCGRGSEGVVDLDSSGPGANDLAESGDELWVMIE